MLRSRESCVLMSTKEMIHSTAPSRACGLDSVRTRAPTAPTHRIPAPHRNHIVVSTALAFHPSPRSLSCPSSGPISPSASFLSGPLHTLHTSHLFQLPFINSINHPLIPLSTQPPHPHPSLLYYRIPPPPLTLLYHRLSIVSPFSPCLTILRHCFSHFHS